MPPPETVAEVAEREHPDNAAGKHRAIEHRCDYAKILCNERQGDHIYALKRYKVSDENAVETKAEIQASIEICKVLRDQLEQLFTEARHGMFGKLTVVYVSYASVVDFYKRLLKIMI